MFIEEKKGKCEDCGRDAIELQERKLIYGAITID
jgi:hypothetical protein